LPAAARRIAILGSTGSIGRQALELIERYPERFSVCALAANESVDLLAAQADRLAPKVVSCGSMAAATRVQELLGARRGASNPEIAFGDEGLMLAAAGSEADLVLAATDGLVARRAIFACVERGIDVALANKEIAVSFGEPLFAAAENSGACILPVDSEHSAVFQCLMGERRSDVRSIVLTASGGPFWELSEAEMRAATPAQALNHPTWSMGPKNTIDSATLMNKGLEVIEASRFFGLAPSAIEVVIHRQSVAHAFVIFNDGSVKSQLAAPDMRTPIGFALSYPERLENATPAQPTRDAIGLGSGPSMMTFAPVDHARFPCLRLAYRALEHGGTFPAVLSAANEEAGRAFLQGKIKFTDIARLVSDALEAHSGKSASVPEIEIADSWARSFARTSISKTCQV
jgi:1-deoxy-D-xylulose-5-phosphate reductoisomerase